MPWEIFECQQMLFFIADVSEFRIQPNFVKYFAKQEFRSNTDESRPAGMNKVHHLCTVDGSFDICVDQGTSDWIVTTSLASVVGLGLIRERSLFQLNVFKMYQNVYSQISNLFWFMFNLIEMHSWIAFGVGVSYSSIMKHGDFCFEDFKLFFLWFSWSSHHNSSFYANSREINQNR